MNEALNISLKPSSGASVTRSGCFFISGFERQGEKAASARSETLTRKQGRFGVPACILLKLYFCLLCLVYSLKDSLTPNLGKTRCAGLVASALKLARAGSRPPRRMGLGDHSPFSPGKAFLRGFPLLPDVCTD